MHHCQGRINWTGITLERKQGVFRQVWRDSTERSFSGGPVAHKMVPETGQLGICRRGTAARQSSGHARLDPAAVLELARDQSNSTRELRMSRPWSSLAAT
jgi:hypothetical protein